MQPDLVDQVADPYPPSRPVPQPRRSDVAAWRDAHGHVGFVGEGGDPFEDWRIHHAAVHGGHLTPEDLAAAVARSVTRA